MYKLMECVKENTWNKKKSVEYKGRTCVKENI